MSGSGGKNGKGGGRRRDHLSDDDAAVWEHTARSLVPLKKPNRRVHAAIGDEPPDAVFSPKPSTSSDARRKGAAVSSPTPLRAEPAPRTKPAPELQAFDTKRARRLRSGRTEIEARLDLHGMKQVEAHAALRRFLLSCHGNGLRTVLVITGKGGTARRDETESWAGGYERGVLKRNVPNWLAEPELRRIVVSFTESAIRHGGEGAIYVYLRSEGKLIDRG